MPRPRKRPQEQTGREPSGRELKARAEALLITARALAVCAAIQRGDRTIGFRGPTSNADGDVAPQMPDEEWSSRRRRAGRRRRK
jgi:hypothetical protein